MENTKNAGDVGSRHPAFRTWEFRTRSGIALTGHIRQRLDVGVQQEARGLFKNRDSADEDDKKDESRHPPDFRLHYLIPQPSDSVRKDIQEKKNRDH